MRSVSKEYEEALDKLYSASPEEFINVRNRLAAKLREVGGEEDSARIKDAKKPTVAAWALNQISRRHRNELEQLFRSNDRLAQSRGREAREAAAARHHAVTTLVDAASSYLEEAGRTATAPVKERITETLYAVATDEEARTLLERGRLTRDVKSGALGSFEVAAQESGDIEADAEKDEAARKEREEKVAKLRADAEKLSEQADQLRGDAARLIQAADQLTERATDLKKEADAVDQESP